MPDPLIELPHVSPAAARLPDPRTRGMREKAQLKHVYRAAPPPRKVGSTPHVGGATGRRSPSTDGAAENTEMIVKEFRRDGCREDGQAILPLVLEEDKALLRNLGKLRYMQHQLCEKQEKGSSSQDLEEATALFRERLTRFHETHTEAIATYLPQMCARPSPTHPS